MNKIQTFAVFATIPFVFIGGYYFFEKYNKNRLEACQKNLDAIGEKYQTYQAVTIKETEKQKNKNPTKQTKEYITSNRDFNPPPPQILDSCNLLIKTYNRLRYAKSSGEH